jgi:hypothetical protein
MPSVGRSRDKGTGKEDRGLDAPHTAPEVAGKNGDLQVFVALAVPIFAISALIIGVCLALSPR